MKLSFRHFVFILAFISFIVRIFFFVVAYIKIPLSSDEGIIGLMTMHVLKGEFPVVFWGQPYMGTFESFFNAPLIYLFGETAISVRIYPFLCSLLFVFLLYKLAYKIYNKEVALITLLLLTIPVPYISMCSFYCPGNNIGTVVFGMFAFLILYELTYNEKTKNKTIMFAVLGFLLGFGFWYSMLIAGYILVIIVMLFLKDKFLLFRKNFWVCICMFAIGSAPIFIYNIRNDFVSFQVTASGVDMPQMLENLKMFFAHTVQFLIGTKVMLYCDSWHYVDLPRPLFSSLLILAILLICIAIFSRFKKIWHVCILSLKNTDGTVILVMFAVITIFTFCRTGRSNWWAVRYILPLMSVLPILIAYGLWWIKKYTKAGFYAITVILVLAYGWGNVLLVKEWNDPKVISEKLDFPDTKVLIKFLNENNIKHAYATFWLAYRLTYETKEEIIVSQTYNERFVSVELPYLKRVQQAENVAYILHDRLGMKPEYFEEKMKEIGGEYKKQEIDTLPESKGQIPTGFVVFYGFKPPYGEGKLTEISREKWKVSSNFKTEDAFKAIDGDINTRWGSGTHQSAGMYFLVDMGNEYEISKIHCILGEFLSDFPRGYKVEVSKDSNSWVAVAKMGDVCGSLFWSKFYPCFFVGNDFINIGFKPGKARYVKITQTGSDPRFDWSIVEINVYG